MRLSCRHHVWVPWLRSQTCNRCGLIRDIVSDDGIQYTYPPLPPPPIFVEEEIVLPDGRAARGGEVRVWEMIVMRALDAQDAAWDDIPPEPEP
jgi:hypothetical protein